jgi:iron complex transport system substrate-binding protein
MKKSLMAVILVLLLGAFSVGYLFARVSIPPTTHVKTPVERVVSLAAACTEIIYAIGAENKLVGVDQSSVDYALAGNEMFLGAPGKLSDYPKEVPNKPNVGKSSAPNLEMIVSLEPDLVFSWWFNAEVNKNIGNKGIPVLSINPQSTSDVLNLIKTIGTLVGKSVEAEAIVLEMQERIKKVTDKVKDLPDEQKPLVYYELGAALKTVGSGTFTNELISMTGGINIAANETVRYPLLSSEYIIEKNPDIIVVISYGASVEDIKGREGWQNINAVRNNRVYKIESGWVTASPRLVLGLEQFAKWFHPELFS